MFLGASYIGVDGDPPALGQGRPFHRYDRAVGAIAINIVRFKRTGDFDPLSNKRLKIIDVTVLTAQSEMTNSILKGGTVGDQLVWEVKHFFKREAKNLRSEAIDNL